MKFSDKKYLGNIVESVIKKILKSRVFDLSIYSKIFEWILIWDVNEFKLGEKYDRIVKSVVENGYLDFYVKLDIVG